MTQQAIFGISVLFGLMSWGIVAKQYIWPALRDRPVGDALRPLLVFHSFRYIGLTFLMPGVVSPDLPVAFAGPAAYGDFITAILAVIALFLLPGVLGIVVTWAFTIVGSLDLLNAFIAGNRVGLVPGQQGAMYFVPTVLVPLLLITHGLVFRILLRRARPRRGGVVP